MVIILFKMENTKKGGPVHRPMVLDGTKNPSKIIAEDKYEDCEDPVEYDTKENLKFSKILRKFIRRLDKRCGNNILTISSTINTITSIGVTFIIKEKMVKDNISTILIEAKGSNFLNAETLDIFNMNAQVF